MIFASSSVTNRVILLLLLYNTTAAQASYEHSVTLAAGQVHETCNSLAAGVALNYQYTGNSVTLFNIHYHNGKKVSYPVPDFLAFRTSGSLKTESAQNYCLMWKNIRNIPAIVRYRVDFPKNDLASE